MAIANAAKWVINVFGPERRRLPLAPPSMNTRFRRLIQMGIIMYVVLYALMLQKGYQESSVGNGIDLMDPTGLAPFCSYNYTAKPQNSIRRTLPLKGVHRLRSRWQMSGRRREHATLTPNISGIYAYGTQI